MPYVQLDNFRLYYQSSPDGSGCPIVLLHGFTLDHRLWGQQADYFKGKRPLIIPDARGHGKSDAPATGYSRRERVDDLLGLVDNIEIEKFHLVGLSMGGSTAIKCALEHQERLKSLTLISSSVAGSSIGPRISRIDRLAKQDGLEAARRAWMRAGLAYFSDEQKAIRDLVERMNLDHSGAPWMDERRGKYPPPGNDLYEIRTLKLPTAIFVGMRDKTFVPLASKLHEGIEGSRLFQYDHIGHLLNIEAPDRLNADLSQFLDEVDPI